MVGSLWVLWPLLVVGVWVFVVVWVSGAFRPWSCVMIWGVVCSCWLWCLAAADL